MEEDFLDRKLSERTRESAFRQLRIADDKVDFFSNDYLGMVRNNLVGKELASVSQSYSNLAHGSTGSRLLSGNYPLIEETEKKITFFHNAKAGLIFNSGYDANLGLLSAVPQKEDTILYDQFSHASIRDGIRLSFARSFSFLHNDLQDLEKKLLQASGNIFVVTESVFSMDGDTAPLVEMTKVSEKYKAKLIVDEAHATGVIGPRGEGLVQELGLEDKCFARVHTFGKAVGCHGAIVLGSELLIRYLVNFCRAFIFTTALPETAIKSLNLAYSIFPTLNDERRKLRQLITQYRKSTTMPDRNIDRGQPIDSLTAIQGFLIPDNNRLKALSGKLAESGIDVRPILYPSVARGKERLRIILHSYNSEKELNALVSDLW
jgi:8-amino-7-oxononanoate synthase